MPAPPRPQRLNLKQFADRFRSDMIPLGSRFCYFAAALSLSAEDIREYLEEPVAALPPAIAAQLPPVRILLVPYLADPANPAVFMEKPDGGPSLSASVQLIGPDALLAFAIKETEVADYHYRFYHAIAELVAGPAPGKVPAGYVNLLRQEFGVQAHGEVDEASWTLKNALGDNEKGKRMTRPFREYARASYIDTLTLYLHGICCDIDVEPGPRQIPSYLLRRRLRLLRELFPPPKGYAVLPEDSPETTA
jgi:hypothetical protein